MTLCDDAYAFSQSFDPALHDGLYFFVFLPLFLSFVLVLPAAIDGPAFITSLIFVLCPHPTSHHGWPRLLLPLDPPQWPAALPAVAADGPPACCEPTPPAARMSNTCPYQSATGYHLIG
eukprot:scaffold14293_cov20-Tisochrysis_lutea.AAC.1